MDISPESNKEYIWCAKLDKSKKVFQWEGLEDGSMEQVVLKRACLATGVKDNERNIVQVTSFNHKSEKIDFCLCSLRSGLQEDVSLSDVTILPPAVFKLVAGSGPVHVVGSHMIMADDFEGSDQDSDLSDEADKDEMSTDDDDIDDMDDEDEEEEATIKALKSLEAAQKKAKSQDFGQDNDDEDDEEDDDDIDDDEDEEDDEEIEEEKPEVKPDSKKRKAETNKVNKDNKKTKVDKNLTTPKKQDTKKTPKKEPTTPSAPKTPLQQKENKTPASAKKTPKTYSSVSELLVAIKKYPGGKPKKEEKFANWVKHTFRVASDEWIKKLWKAHKADLGL